MARGGRAAGRRRAWRRFALVGLLAVGAWLAYEAWTWPRVGALATRPPRTTAFIERYRAEQRAAGRDDRVQWTGSPYAGHLDGHQARRAGRRGHRLLRPRGRRPRRDGGRARARRRAEGAAARRLHHHPAAREEPLADALAQSAPQGARGDPRLAARADALEAPDPRALPERRRVRAGVLRGRGGGAPVLREGRGGRGAGGGGTARGQPAEPATLASRARRAAPIRPT